MDPYQQQNPNQQPLEQPQPVAPQPPTNYGAPQPPAYDPNYLDTIAPPPPRPSFFSGSFGKIFFILLGVFVFAVSLIIAFSGKDNTADLQLLSTRIENLSLVSKSAHPKLKSNNLSTADSIFQAWIVNSSRQAKDLLDKAGVKKSQYAKTMVASEKAIAEELDQKFTDARLNAMLDRVYANTMSTETAKLIALFNTMAKTSKSPVIREYAKSTSADLVPIQKSFADYVDDGN
ncbi:hypothetical protein KC953_00725 [Candidatus Saccharibacteria bacterium]|nr:hypothetical protein [Candidatus Saccharibacteria bacterium]